VYGDCNQHLRHTQHPGNLGIAVAFQETERKDLGVSGRETSQGVPQTISKIVTVRLAARQPALTSASRERRISSYPQPFPLTAGTTQTWVMWPTSKATRLLRHMPQRRPLEVSSAIKDAGWKNVPQPGY
jgi:hypothetical protein